jgi:hypothetical protein
MCFEYSMRDMPYTASWRLYGQFFLFLPDVSNGFFLEILSFKSAAKPLGNLAVTSWAEFHLRIGRQKTHALAIISKSPV